MRAAGAAAAGGPTATGVAAYPAHTTHTAIAITAATVATSTAAVAFAAASTPPVPNSAYRFTYRTSAARRASAADVPAAASSRTFFVSSFTTIAIAAVLTASRDRACSRLRTRHCQPASGERWRRDGGDCL